GVMKHASRRDGGAGPQQRAARGVQEKLERAAARRAGERRRNRRKSWDEFRDEQRLHSPSLEIRFGLAHARIRRERDAAEKSKNAIAVDASEEKPNPVGDERRDQRADHHVRRRHLSAARQCAGDDQRWNGRNRHADLLEKNIERDQRDSVTEDERSEAIFQRTCSIRIGALPVERRMRGIAPPMRTTFVLPLCDDCAPSHAFTRQKISLSSSVRASSAGVKSFGCSLNELGPLSVIASSRPLTRSTEM